MVEKQIKDHAQHLKELLGKAMTNKPDYIKELIDYIVLSHSSGYVSRCFYLDPLCSTLDMVLHRAQVVLYD